MRKLPILFVFLTFVGCEKTNLERLKELYPEQIQIETINPLELNRTDEIISIMMDDVKRKYSDFNPEAFCFYSGSKELPSQVNDFDQDGKGDEIIFAADFNSEEKKSVIIGYAKSGKKVRKYQKRTQAELSVKFGGHFEGEKYIGGDFKNVDFLRLPDKHVDHDTYIRYEGPGWESDKVGYRFYLDRRNAIDIFGKKTVEMVLQNVGHEDTDTYHEMADWGMDIFKVGESLGVGSIAMWKNNRVYMVSETDSITCRIKENGTIQSKIETCYFGWQVGRKKLNLTSTLSINMGSRKTHHSVYLSDNQESLCTGLIKNSNCTLIKSENSEKNGWKYFALYGQQSLAGDNLGTAILYRSEDINEIIENEDSHVIVFKPGKIKLTYYFLAAWQQEEKGITDLDGFKNYLNKQVQLLNNPIQVTL